MLAKARRDGLLRPGVMPAATARALVGGFFGVQHVSEMLTGRQDLEARLDEFWKVFLVGIAAEPTGRAPSGGRRVRTASAGTARAGAPATASATPTAEPAAADYPQRPESGVPPVLLDREHCGRPPGGGQLDLVVRSELGECRASHRALDQPSTARRATRSGLPGGIDQHHPRRMVERMVEVDRMVDRIPPDVAIGRSAAAGGPISASAVG